MQAGIVAAAADTGAVTVPAFFQRISVTVISQAAGAYAVGTYRADGISLAFRAQMLVVVKTFATFSCFVTVGTFCQRKGAYIASGRQNIADQKENQNCQKKA